LLPFSLNPVGNSDTYRGDWRHLLFMGMLVCEDA